MKARYVIAYGQVCDYEEKAPFTPSGKSVLGALEYDRDTDQVKCHECGRWFRRLDAHVKLEHLELTTGDYKAKHALIGSLKAARLVERISTYTTARLATSVNARAYFSDASRQGERVRKCVTGTLARAEAARTCTGEPICADTGDKAKRKRIRRLARKQLANTGLDGLRAVFFEPTAKMGVRNLRATCPAQLIARVRAVAESLGRSPKIAELCDEKGSIPRPEALSHNQLLVLCGLEPRPGQGEHMRKYDKAILIELLRDFYFRNKRLPKNREFGVLLPTLAAYRYNFGSRGNAFEAAGLDLVARNKAEQVPDKGHAA